MSDEMHETPLEKATRETDEAEAQLRVMKERLIPRERAEALNELLEHELAAMTDRVNGDFVPRFVEASRGSEADRHAVFEAYQAALVAGAERVFATLRDETAASTLAAIEDRERADRRRGGLP